MTVQARHQKFETKNLKIEQFVYATHIRTTPERLWQALTQPDFTRRYWLETTPESTWKPGASWAEEIPDGTATITGGIVKRDRPQHPVFSWRSEAKREEETESYSQAAYELENLGDSGKLTLIPEIDKPASTLLRDVSGGWPPVLASLKGLMETGEPLEATNLGWLADGAGPALV